SRRHARSPLGRVWRRERLYVGRVAAILISRAWPVWRRVPDSTVGGSLRAAPQIWRAAALGHQTAGARRGDCRAADANGYVGPYRVLQRRKRRRGFARLSLFAVPIQSGGA